MTLGIDMHDSVIRKRLEVDERPLKKLARRVLQISSQDNVSDADDDIKALKTDIDSYEHTIRRLTLLLKANAREIERYNAQKEAIRQTYARTEQDILVLKRDLEAEQQAREDRLSYDILAQDIQSSAPKSRKIQQIAIAKLELEILGLEKENMDYNHVWQMRKAGFDDIMLKLLALQKEILGERADAELRDAADSDEEEGAVGNPNSELSTSAISSGAARGTYSHMGQETGSPSLQSTLPASMTEQMDIS